MNSVEGLKSLIKQYDIISFDIFNTLIKRNYSDVKILNRLVSKVYKDQTGNTLDFHYKRTEAESKARKLCEYREVNIDEIYEYFEHPDKNIIKSIEAYCELELTQANSEMLEVFNYCIREKKEIYIISDMFYDGLFLEKLLNKNGICGYKKLYSSCDYRVTKWERGELLKKVLEDNNLDANNVLHIGDDLTADYKMAIRQGMAAFHYQEESQNIYGAALNLCEENGIFANILERFIINNYPKTKSRAYQLGFEIFGPLLMGCCTWLKEMVIELDLKQVFFFSRDGYIWEKGFNVLNDDEGIEVSYFWASRRSIIVPYFQFCCDIFEMLDCYKSFPPKFSMEFLIQKLGLEDKNVIPILNKYGFSIDDILIKNKLKENTKLINFFDELLPIIKSNSRKEADILKQYFRQEFFEGRVGIVDIGAGCSIEIALEKLIDKMELNLEIVPLYLYSRLEVGQNRFAFLDINSRDKELNNVFRFCYMLMEVFFSAPHGSVKRYSYNLENHNVETVCYDYEYDGDNGHYGCMINEIQEGALNFVTLFKKIIGSIIQIDSKISISVFKNFGLFPQYDDVLYLGPLKFDSDTFKCLVAQEDSSFSLASLKTFKKSYVESLWLAGFIVKYFSSRFMMRLVYGFYSFGKGVLNGRIDKLS